MTQSPVRSDRPTTMAVVEPRAALPSVFNRLLTLMAAAVGPVIFVLFIDRYAVNVPQVDDWFVIPLVHSALHGHLTLTGLWTQFHHDRLLVGNLVFVFFGNIDRLDLRAITMFGAAAMIVGYGFLLALFRAYLDRPLTPIPTLIMGLVWFSLADVQNTLWAFQVSWFLVLPCLTGMLFFLLVPRSNRTLWVVLAVLAAVIASCSAIQGFLLWPIGLAVLLWPDPRNRHAIRKRYCC